ncbi:archease [archaeon]|nr:archease [archaeon]
MSFRYLEHTADILFEAEALTVEELFCEAGKALGNSMIDLKAVEGKQEKTIELEDESIEFLLHAFLEQVLYLMETELIAFNDFDVKVNEKQGKFYLKAIAFGEKIDKARHELKADVKAVTWEYFKLGQEKGKWKCKVLLDV